MSLMLPPYDDERQAFAEALAGDADRGAFGWTRAEALRYYEAGRRPMP